ncbi:MAG: glycerol-3-phosphate dehydrogenase/oxidase [bacterium]
MKRDLIALSNRSYDVLVIGGGVYGAFLTREAALRGLSTAVIDAKDFCSATSANSLKIIHGGLRYLQQLDIPRVRESASERHNLMRLAPHIVHPLPCIMPTTGWGLRSRPVMRAGLLVNDLLSFDRNRTGDLEKYIPNGRVISKEECLGIIPGLAGLKVTGAAAWHDAIACNTERLVLGAVMAACEAGAVAANYVRLTGFTRKDKSITGVLAEDTLTGAQCTISAKLIINAAGPWIPDILSLAKTTGTPPVRQLTLAMNFVLKRQLIKSYAAGLTSPGIEKRKKRLLFFAPWRGQTMAGTYYRLHSGSAGNMKVSAEDVTTFLADLNRAYPLARLQHDDIAVIHAGLQPAMDTSGEPDPVGHYKIVNHAIADGIEGLITVVGVKYTTARDVAAKAIDLACSKLERMAPDRQAASAAIRLPGGEIPDYNGFLREVQQTAGGTPGEGHTRRLATNYGTVCRTLINLCRTDSRMGPLPGNRPDITGAEVVHAIRSEMAQTLPDIVFRRTDLGSAGMPDETTVRACADLAALEAGWDAKRKDTEITQTLALAERPGRCL